LIVQETRLPRRFTSRSFLCLSLLFRPERRSHYRWGFISGEPRTTREFGMLHQSIAVKMTSKDRTETSIGGAQKDTMREWAGRAANMQPVMRAGVITMTLVARHAGQEGGVLCGNVDAPHFGDIVPLDLSPIRWERV
jgi:hypothetical protein